jgi:hypothetical protein
VQLHGKEHGARAGAEIAEVYVALPASADEPPKRLAGWSKVHLNPGESREVSLPINPRELSIYDESTRRVEAVAGSLHLHGRRLIQRPAATAGGKPSLPTSELANPAQAVCSLGGGADLPVASLERHERFVH